MLVLGLTGGIGSGKSFVMEIISHYEGVVTLSADRITRFVLQKGQVGYSEVVNAFGEEILSEDQEIDRKRLGGLVFEDRHKLLDLEKLVHPLVREHLKKNICEIEESQESEEKKTCLVIEIPLLYEAGFEDLVDKVLVVACTEDKQFERCYKRDGLSEKDVRQRTIRQMPLREKVAKADFVIDNNLSMDQTRRQVEDLWPNIIKIG
ncbi:dephospho-CoA kinase [PVC group bacterium (ex Bugula neritina AB1)]|nr:dephospho-CoA kinase [PVC group bacterium (ex Bugula neritina AB1)]